MAHADTCQHCGTRLDSVDGWVSGAPCPVCGEAPDNTNVVPDTIGGERSAFGGDAGGD